MTARFPNRGLNTLVADFGLGTRGPMQPRPPGTAGTRPNVGKWGVVKRFYDQVQTRSAANWPRGLRANPYKFEWPAEDCRDLFLHLLMTPVGGRTRYAHKDLLRFLLFRFQISKQLDSVPVPGMERFRWRWFSSQELTQFLQQDERQLRDEVRFLVERGLLVKEYEPGRMKFPHYRPSDDLFRICLKVTMLSDVNYLCAQFETDRVFPDELRLYKDACRRIFLGHTAELHRLLSDFMASDSPDRATVCCDGLDRLIDAVWPEDEVEGGEL